MSSRRPETAIRILTATILLCGILTIFLGCEEIDPDENGARDENSLDPLASNGEIVTASGENLPNEGKDKAFDGRTDTKWLTFADSAWIQYEFGKDTKKVIDKYKITSANDHSERDPKDWQLRGSDDGSSWTTIDSRNGESFSSRFQTKTFEIANSTAYKMYRLVISSNFDPPAANSTQLAEIEFVEGTSTGTGSSGLQGTYFNDMNLTDKVLDRIDPTVDFEWSRGSPDAQIEDNTFSARWTGFVEARFSETYTFYTVSDDGIRLWVDDKLIVNNWTNHGPTENKGTISLQAGKSYAIKMEYYENSGGALAKLLWSSAGQAKQVIPKEQLSTDFVENDLCPNDPDKTEPGACGCNVPEDSCDGVTLNRAYGNELRIASYNVMRSSVFPLDNGNPDGNAARIDGFRGNDLRDFAH